MKYFSEKSGKFEDILQTKFNDITLNLNYARRAFGAVQEHAVDFERYSTLCKMSISSTSLKKRGIDIAENEPPKISM